MEKKCVSSALDDCNIGLSEQPVVWVLMGEVKDLRYCQTVFLVHAFNFCLSAKKIALLLRLSNARFQKLYFKRKRFVKGILEQSFFFCDKNWG